MEGPDITGDESDEWSIEPPAERPSTDPPAEPEDVGRQTSEWLIAPPRAVRTPAASRRSRPSAKPKPKAKPELRPPAAGPPAPDPELDALRARVAELEEQLAAALARAERAEARAEAAGRRIARATEGTQELAGRPGSDRLAINDADYDELRALGLSVSESAQLLAMREVRGGFTSLDELDDATDFTAERLTELKSRLRI